MDGSSKILTIFNHAVQTNMNQQNFLPHQNSNNNGNRHGQPWSLPQDWQHMPPNATMTNNTCQATWGQSGAGTDQSSLRFPTREPSGSGLYFQDGDGTRTYPYSGSHQLDDRSYSLRNDDAQGQQHEAISGQKCNRTGYVQRSTTHVHSGSRETDSGQLKGWQTPAVVSSSGPSGYPASEMWRSSSEGNASTSNYVPAPNSSIQNTWPQAVAGQAMQIPPPAMPPPPSHFPPPPHFPPPMPSSPFDLSAPPPRPTFSQPPPGFPQPPFHGNMPRLPDGNIHFSGNMPQFPDGNSSFQGPPFLYQRFPTDSSKHNLLGGSAAIGARDMTGDGQGPGEAIVKSHGAQEEVNKWLKKMGKYKESALEIADSGREAELSQQSNKEPDKSLTICEAHNGLRKILHSLAAVQGALQQLEDDRETANSDTWKTQVDKIMKLKGDYLTAKQQLDQKQVLELQRKLELRRKKRMRIKRRKQEDRDTAEQLLFERTQKHAAIDKWRDQIQQEHLRQKQIKEMKETADRTLGKVRRETREARKMLDTLTGLQKLRTIRTETATRRGQTFPSDVAEHFTDKTDDLIKLLSQQIEAYEQEEAALKLILENEQEEAKEKERQAKREQERERKQQEIHMQAQSLFGPPVLHTPGDPMLVFESFYQQSQFDLQALLSIRHSWDMFLVPENVPGASRIPDNWVEPDQPSSVVWASALQSEMEVEATQSQDSADIEKQAN